MAIKSQNARARSHQTCLWCTWGKALRAGKTSCTAPGRQLWACNPSGAPAQMISGSARDASPHPLETSAGSEGRSEAGIFLLISKTQSHSLCFYNVTLLHLGSCSLQKSCFSPGNNKEMMAFCVKSLGVVGLEKHSASLLAEPGGNQRSPKPNVSRGATLRCRNKYQRKT